MIPQCELNKLKEDIIETGSNENGEWIKFSGGRMICCGIQTRNINTYNSFNDYLRYGYTAELVFAQNFIEKPIVLASQTSDADIISIQVGHGVSTTGTGTLYPIAPAHLNVDVPIQYIAIGKWK